MTTRCSILVVAQGGLAHVAASEASEASEADDASCVDFASLPASTGDDGALDDELHAATKRPSMTGKRQRRILSTVPRRPYAAGRRDRPRRLAVRARR